MKFSYFLTLLFALGACTQTSHPTTNPDPVATRQKQDSIPVSIMIPKDLEGYKTAMTDYINDGGSDPSLTWTFTSRQIKVPRTADLLKAAADTAASIVRPGGGGPQKAFVTYLKVKSDTAFVTLNIDEDGWAGVSYSTSKIHPIVTKTLMGFKGIKEVVFGKSVK